MSEVLDYTQQCLHRKSSSACTLLSTAFLPRTKKQRDESCLWVSAEWTEEVYLATLYYELQPKQKSVNPHRIDGLDSKFGYLATQTCCSQLMFPAWGIPLGSSLQEQMMVSTLQWSPHYPAGSQVQIIRTLQWTWVRQWVTNTGYNNDFP